jgi:hypothetical protein
MKKTLISIIVLALVAWGIYYYMNNDGATKARGVVTAVDKEGAMVDGPYIITLDIGDGKETEIHIPSMGIMLCEGRENIVGIDEVETGMKVEAKGTRLSEGAIVPCESKGHYVRIVE